MRFAKAGIMHNTCRSLLLLLSLWLYAEPLQLGDTYTRVEYSMCMSKMSGNGLH